jgi:lysyl-tRNA synthetase class 2
MGQPSPDAAITGGEDQVADRRAKLQRFRDELGIDPYGRRVDGLMTIAQARASFDPVADAAAQADPADDRRPRATVAGRVMLRRVMGNLVFLTLRDHSGEVQVGVSKKAVAPHAFQLAKHLDLADLVVASGPVGATKTGELTIWAAGSEGFTLACKSLIPPPNKVQGLTDPELRYRHRYIDLWANPQVMRTFEARSRIVSEVRRFLTDRGFLEVETPMMQPIPGGAAARPFITHHNALDMPLYLRVAPELYLKRLLVGGMPRVFEINRNFRNEGIDRSHNPEFTMLELYEAFGDLHSVMHLTESLLNHLCLTLHASDRLTYAGRELNLKLPFARAGYHELFARHNGFDPADGQRLAARAAELHIPLAHEGKPKAHDVLLNEVWEESVEPHLVQPTFVIDYPASLCPLTRPKPGDPGLAERFELFISNMEVANAYTELNDPDIQEANFRQQLDGQDAEEATFRNVDEDFLHALRVGMPPAGGLGIGIDRAVMLLTDSPSIRDVILFPLLRHT